MLLFRLLSPQVDIQHILTLFAPQALSFMTSHHHHHHRHHDYHHQRHFLAFDEGGLSSLYLCTILLPLVNHGHLHIPSDISIVFEPVIGGE